jgi:predicted DNA-binding protein (UPF0251 family)
MSEMPNVPPLPEYERRQRLEKFLDAINEHHSLAPLRAILRTPEDRYLALVAALERSVLRGSPSAVPPPPDDEADQILCDILDAFKDHPDLKHYGAYYGSYQHLANLQALGLWRGDQPLTRPVALDLFATRFRALTADTTSTSPALPPNNSPTSQQTNPNGELIALSPTQPTQSIAGQSSPEPLDSVVGVAISPDQSGATTSFSIPGIIRHDPTTPGENLTLSHSPSPPLSPSALPNRPLRRGRPIKLDDFAKGRLLGLMSYGLSFRQAAAQLGVHHQTVLNALKRDEQFAQQVTEARLDAISQPLLAVIQASRTNWRAAAWLTKYLDTRRATDSATETQ